VHVHARAQPRAPQVVTEGVGGQDVGATAMPVLGEPGARRVEAVAAQQQGKVGQGGG
jgi:hypothetical protein